MNNKSKQPVEGQKSPKPPKDAGKSADPKQVGQTGNMQ